MKIFDEITGEITGMDESGAGTLTNAGKKILVRFAVPGDAVRAKIVKRRRGELLAEILEITSRAETRVAAACPDAARCGGCPLMTLEYSAQKIWKRKLVEEAFRETKLEIKIPEPIGCAALARHRNRIDYVIARNDFGEPVVGLKEPGRWWKTLELKNCLMLSPAANEILAVIREWLNEYSISIWDRRAKAGLLRYVVIREGKNTGKRMVILTVADLNVPDLDKLLPRLAPFATSVYLAVNPKITDLSIGEKYILLSGEKNLAEKVAEIKYEIPPVSFFQTSTAGAESLAETVIELADLEGRETVLDLFCGVGFFSLQLARRANRVLGVELDPAAVEAARRNAEQNGITNAEFRAEAAEALSWETEKPDLVLLDPPRAGLHPRVLKLLLEKLPPRIIYVSCNFRSLARELPIFLARYELKDIRLLDLFPHTPHVETVVVLAKNR